MDLAQKPFRGAVLAFALLAAGVAAQAAESLQSLLARASRAAQEKKLETAESLSREAVRRFPQSAEAQRTLAYVLLWQGDYGEARERFAQVLARNGRDAEARLGSAQAHYWSGDYRGALREFERVLAVQPGNTAAQAAVAEIRAAARPGYTLYGNALEDDQPYRGAGIDARLFFFSDPLTKWEVSVGGARLRGDGETGETSQVGVAGETTLPAFRTRVRGAVDRFRYPDGTAALLPGVRVHHSFASTELTATAERRPLLRSATALRTHPSADALGLRWSREAGHGIRFAAGAEHLRYFDRNRGWGADAYVLSPSLRLGSSHVAFGVSAAYRDTDEPRFRAVDPVSLRGVYDPYYTPHALGEVRAVLAATIAPRRGFTASLHLDGGTARDRVIGTTPAGDRFDFARTFHPWRAGLETSFQLSPRVVVSLHAAREQTVFYTASELRAGVAGRF